MSWPQTVQPHVTVQVGTGYDLWNFYLSSHCSLFTFLQRASWQQAPSQEFAVAPRSKLSSTHFQNISSPIKSPIIGDYFSHSSTREGIAFQLFHLLLRMWLQEERLAIYLLFCLNVLEFSGHQVTSTSFSVVPWDNLVSLFKTFTLCVLH